MDGTSYQSYEAAVQDYLAQFTALLEAPDQPLTAARRGVGDVPTDTLVDRADQIADVSAQIIPLAKRYLQADERATREGTAAQLVSQATAELQLATELFEAASAGTEGQAPTAVRRSAGGVALSDAIRSLETSLQTPVSEGLAAAVPRVRAGAVPTTIEEARRVLQQATVQALDTIAQRVRELGGDIAFDLITATKWAAVVEGAGLVREDIAAKLEAIKQGIFALFSRAVTVAIRTLLNVYDKLLALLGQDVEDKARTQIQEWLQQIEKEKKVELFEILVDKLYQIGPYKKELEDQLAATTAPIETLNQTMEAVKDVSGRFVVLANRLSTAQSTASLAKVLGFPQVLLAVAGIQVALLAILVYAGYDYIGYRQGQFLDITKGVDQVLQEYLGDAA